ncbi:hypothetical protein [uncultured Tenacibaculum sp.]|uniref:hypothetical protein n=1 Tax=uncultured Tenacibaculum sp. TaxID=174713 RepID=UPI0026387ED6|nr:hypothetical protein [uncultured Tenacibaculum sp.]
MYQIEKIVELSKEYQEALFLMNQRLSLWNESKSSLILSTLSSIKDRIIAENDFFKKNLYTEKINHGKLIVLRAGNIPVTISNEVEQGFSIQFHLHINGKVIVGYTNNSISENNGFNILKTYEDLNLITEEEILKLVYEGIEKSMQSSFLFE